MLARFDGRLFTRHISPSSPGLALYNIPGFGMCHEVGAGYGSYYEVADVPAVYDLNLVS